MPVSVSEFAQMNKPREVEERLDTYLIRPLGYLLVRWLRHTPVTPNMVSIASAMAGIGAAAFYFRGDLTGAAGGLVMLVLSSMLDSADGQLARATGQGSELGRLLDGVCDNVSFVAIYIAILSGYAARGGPHVLPVFLLALASGISHSTQSALTDYQRLLFLYYCYGGREPESEQPEQLRSRLTEMRLRGESLLHRVLLRLHLNYSHQQRKVLHTSDRLQREYQAAMSSRPEIREDFAAVYRERNTQMIRWWALLGPNSHKLGLVAASLVPLLAPEGNVQRLGMVLYFFYDLTALNVAMFFLLRRQGSKDEELRRWLAARLAR
jgi:hypothetical protein